MPPARGNDLLHPRWGNALALLDGEGMIGRLQRRLPDGQINSIYQKYCQPLLREIFIFRFSEIYVCLGAIPRPSEGRTRNRHERWLRGAVDVSAQQGERRGHGRRNRVVLIPRRCRGIAYGF